MSPRNRIDEVGYSAALTGTFPRNDILTVAGRHRRANDNNADHAALLVSGVRIPSVPHAIVAAFEHMPNMHPTMYEPISLV
jgi:hypothetical protein